MSEVTDAAYSSPRLPLEEGGETAVVASESGIEGRFALEAGVGVDGTAESATGSSFGVGMGVTSVEGVTSTSSASRYHFLRRV